MARSSVYIGDPALRCGKENVAALTRLVLGHVAAAPDDAPLDDAALGELHAYLQDADILAAVKIAAGLS